MMKFKKGLAVCLVAAMIGALLQEPAIAGELPDTGQFQDMEYPEEGSSLDEEESSVQEGVALEEPEEAIDSRSLEAVSTETFRVLTEGQELHHTKAAQEFYRFQPEESGWYRFMAESKTDCKFSVGVKQTIYYEDSVEKKQDYSDIARYKIYKSSKAEQLMWLDKEEIYEFYCSVSSYEDPDHLDVALLMKRTDISGMETAASPSAPSNNAFIGTGMQVDIHYQNGESVRSDVDCSYVSYGESSGSSTNTLRVLSWSDIAHRKESFLSRQIRLLSVDGDEGKTDIYRLSEGEHTAKLGVQYSISGTSADFELQAKFQVMHNPVKEITVIQARESYTDRFGQSLEPVTIEAVHEDGKKETLSSSHTSVYQYFPGEELEGPDGEAIPMPYMDIDSYMDYLEREGKLEEDGSAKAEVVVEYQGARTSYPVTIERNPYCGISVEPKTNIFYMDASDNILVSDVGKVTLPRADGAAPESYAQITSIPGNAYSRYGDYGLELEGKQNKYKSIQEYQKAGGTAGSKQVVVSYLEYHTSFDIELRENPYERIELEQEPEKKEYLYSHYTQRIDAKGLVFRAYKHDGTYDTYTYGSKEGAVESWSRYFKVSAESSGWYLQEGEHTITVSFMDYKADYKIEVKKEPEPEETVYTELKILKAPERTVYYMKEPDNSDYGEVLTEEGLELELTDSKGVTKKYRYGMDASEDGYGSWSEIWREIQIDWDAVDWGTPGTYQALVTCQELEAEFDVMVTDSPVVSFDILRMPEKMAYYRYEGIGMDFEGMSYQIVFDDGSIHAETIRSSGSDMDFRYQGRYYRVKWDWLKKNSEGYPTYGSNGIVFKLFGQEYQTDPIEIRQNPISSIEFKKAPQKQYYAGNSGSIDLYGAEFAIHYTDGTQLEISVSTHNSYFLVDDVHKKYLTSRVASSWDPDTGENQKCLRVTYMNAVAELPIGIQPSTEDSIGITDGGQTGVLTFGEEKPYRVLSFTPDKTANYYFYCNSSEEMPPGQFQVELYEENRIMYQASGSGWNYPFTFWELKKGTPYYFVVSAEPSNYIGKNRFQCYLSSVVASQEQLGEAKSLTVDTTGMKDSWYSFELESPSLGYLEVMGMSYEITYGNVHRWTEIKYPTTPSTLAGGKMLSASWKYSQQGTGGSWGKPEIREDNAIQFQWGEELLAELPVRLDVPSPVESLTIDNNPMEGRYEYQASKGFQGLAVTIHYKKEAGRPDKTVVWEESFERPMLDGYELQLTWLNEGQQVGNSRYRLQVDYMGASAKRTVTFLPNPVIGFQLSKKPEKSSYYPFETISSPDLYGLEFMVQYRDGRKETIKATEHSNEAAFPDMSKETVRGNVYEKNGVYTLYLEGRGYRQEVMEYTKLPLPFEGAAEIKEGQRKYLVVGEGRPCGVYRLQAEADGKYTFRANGKLNSMLYLYSEEGEQLGVAYLSANQEGSLPTSLGAGETVYYIIWPREEGVIGSMACTLEGEEIEKQEIPEATLEVKEPIAEEELPEVFPPILYEGYDVKSYQWYGGGEGIAAFATAHRLKVILSPDREHCFTSATKLMFNGEEADYTLEPDGTISLYHTFPHTECKVILPQVEGYTLQIKNSKKDRVAYGESFSFQYIETGGSGKELTVKANGTVVPLGADGFYTLTSVTENTTVLVKPKQIEAGEGESLLLLYNKSEEPYDTMIGKQNQSIHDNEKENTLPLLPSYADGSDQFFYGWYLGKDGDWNGKGTRFTSMTKLLEAVYSLYAKWGSGYFSSIVNGKKVSYQVLSFDEYNNMAVQVKGLSKRKAKSAAAIAASEDGKLEIPAVIAQEEMELQEGLELEIAGCQVKTIARDAFSGETGITDVILPDTIEEIGAGAFSGCVSLQEVNLPEQVSKIGANAFSGCTSLRKVVIPDTVTELPSAVFQGCKDLTVVLPDTMRKIDASAFADIEDLSLVCSDKLADKNVIKDLQGAGIPVKAVSLSLEEDWTLSYGETERLDADIRINGELVKDRELVWEPSKTDAYTFQTEGNSLLVTPTRVTERTEVIPVKARDVELGLEATMYLHTAAADIGKENLDGTPRYIVKLADGKYVYSGVMQRPGVTITKTADSSILDGSDYTVSYINNLEAGEAQVVVTGKGNYVGTLRKAFTIAKASQYITASDLKCTLKNYIVPIGASSSGDGKLSYASSNPGVATVDAYGVATIHGLGTTVIRIKALETNNYKESAEKTITLKVEKPQNDNTGTTTPTPPAQTPSKLKVPKTSYEKALGSKPFVLKATANTAISYRTSDSKIATVSKSGKVTLKKCGKAVITVKTHDASKKVTLRIVPKKASLKKVSSPKAGQLKVAWVRQKEAAGYVVEYSTDPKFKKNVKRKTITKNATTSVTLKKLAKGRKYYIRVKAYTKISGKKYYGAMGKIQSKKVKK
ncbi:leucine-rich repeat protein [Lachnospiraceae bacterium 29-84]